MISDIYAQMKVASQSVAWLLRQVTDLTRRITNLEQQPWAAAGGPGGTGGSSGGAFFVLAPASGTIHGTWSGSTPSTAGSFTGTVYQLSGATWTSKGSQTVYNGMPAPLVNGLVCALVPDGAGNFVVYSQSCS